MSEAPDKQGENREKVGPGHPPVEHQFKPGQTGNPNGRPPGKSISNELRKLVDEGHKGTDFAKAMAEAAAKYAAKGDFRFWNAIVDRTEGPVTNKHEVKGDGVFNVIVGTVPCREPDETEQAEG